MASTGKYNFTRRQGQDIRKSKIFDKSLTPDKYVRISDISTSRKRVSRTPEQKKKIFSQGTAATNTKAKLREDHHDLNSPEGDYSQLSELKIKEDYLDSGLGTPISEDDFSNSEKDHSGAKSSRRSKIFNYLQDKSEETSPKFIYTKM